MKAALLAIALTLGSPRGAPRAPGAAPAGPGAAGPRRRPRAAGRRARRAPRTRGPLARARARRRPADRTTAERVLPGGTHCPHGPPLAVGDRFVFAGGASDRPEARAAAIATPAARDRSLGPAEIIAPSAAPGRVWLGNRRGGQIELSEVDRTRAVHERASAPIARWAMVHAEVGGEFLTTLGSGLVLGGERFGDAWFLAAGADRFAWCGDPCPRVGLWSGGRRSDARAAARRRPAGRPRGRVLAGRRQARAVRHGRGQAPLRRSRRRPQRVEHSRPARARTATPRSPGRRPATGSTSPRTATACWRHATGRSARAGCRSAPAAP